MELNEARRRILGQHWRLITAVVLAALLTVAVAGHGNPARYTATTRIVLDAPDPKSRTEAAAIADTAQALATSRAVVTRALASVGVSRDPGEFAKHNVTVQSLGSSVVLQMAVTDTGPKAAAAIANALAEGLIATRSKATSGELRDILATLETRIANLNRKIAKLPARSAGAATTRAYLTQQRAVLQGERESLLGTQALRPTPGVISRANPPDHADPSRLLSNLVLAGILGLVLGVGTAALVEILLPTFAGGDALAAEFDTPYLGRTVGKAGVPLASDAHEVWARLALAAEAAGVADVLLVPVAKRVDVAQLARALEERPYGNGTGVETNGNGVEANGNGIETNGAGVETNSAGVGTTVEHSVESASYGRSRSRASVQVVRAARPRLRIRPLVVTEVPAKNGTAGGVVLVAPRRIRRTDIAEARHLLRLLPWPVLGLIVFEPVRDGGPGAPANGGDVVVTTARTSHEQQLPA